MNRHFTRWPAEDVAKLKELDAAGLDYVAIGRKLKRSVRAVESKLERIHADEPGWITRRNLARAG